MVIVVKRLCKRMAAVVAVADLTSNLSREVTDLFDNPANSIGTAFTVFAWERLAPRWGDPPAGLVRRVEETADRSRAVGVGTLGDLVLCL